MKAKFLLLVSLLVMVILSACGQSSNVSSEGKPTIKIGYLPITHAIPLYIQKEMNEEKEASFHLELVKFSSWPDLMDALNTGRIDGASTLMPVALKANEMGIDLKAVALGHRDGNALVASKDINDVNDLKGKTFAIPHKLSTHNILLYEMLKQEGLEYEDINVVEMTPAEMPGALSRGQVSGYVVAEPMGAQSVVLGNANVLFQSEELWQDAIDCALVFHGDFLKDHQEAAQEFMNGYVKAAKQAETKSEHVQDISSEYMKVDAEVMDLSLKWISYDHLKINKDAYETLSANLIEMGLSENPPAYEEFVNNTLINEVK
ncbi:ABC transporter substrate-binding protein [Oceanobacillus rekensis]|uniref:ABC transporter substrate-binding protein n=1 Tax=Oceanobacillus rekensis TaxID=937927 RepID=UPI000B431E41|nr:ABC transporter substrate-binding protein [Oceanobacillus rekensis]